MKKLRSVLIEAFKDDLWGIVLFGSRARGQGNIYSDWDILIVADRVHENPVERMMLLRDILFRKEVRAISPILRTREEFEKSLRPIYLDIAWDGIILFDREGYLGSKLKEIKEIIKKSGLQRNKKRGNWVWEWERSPKLGEWEIEWKR